jgi:hypothetical protein
MLINEEKGKRNKITNTFNQQTEQGVLYRISGDLLVACSDLVDRDILWSFYMCRGTEVNCEN